MPVIEQDIPVPRPKSFTREVSKLFSALNVGDSVLFTREDYPIGHIQSAIRSALSRYKASNKDRKFITHNIGDDIRVWRTK